MSETPSSTPTPTKHHRIEKKEERLLLAEETTTTTTTTTSAVSSMMKQRRINRERLCRIQQSILAFSILFVVGFLMLNVLVKMKETRRGPEI
tara:strand:+ start:450 stop:725 length:276 start_codon:yes stop_codon:yes gene_type:complete